MRLIEQLIEQHFGQSDSAPSFLGFVVSGVTGVIFSVSIFELITGVVQIGALMGSIGVSIVTIRYILKKTRKL